MDNSTSRQCERSPMQQHQIRSSFKFLEVVGEGAFGKVLKCVDRNTGKTVAIKFGKDRNNLCEEAHMLTVLQHHDMDTFNIITFYGMCNLNSRVGLVFEMLDISLEDYLQDLKGPMRLEDIRTVMEQMATAFDALKRFGIIHTDVKIDNIMMVDHKREPFRVKLIDFGLAVYRSEAHPYRVFQTPFYRSPEIMLGLPFSEAIDMWSLGCVMAVMLFGCILFPARIDFQALRQIIDLLGPPPNHLLKAGRRTPMFFMETDSEQWMLKTSVEYYARPDESKDKRVYKFRSLDQAKEMRLEKDNKTEAEDRAESIELLKAMLTWDQKDRIIPLSILNHPFVTKSYLQSSSHLSACDESEESRAAIPSTGQAQIWINTTKEATLSDEDSDEFQESMAATPSTSQAPNRSNEAKKSTQGADDSTSYSLPRGVIMVQPAAPENRIHLEDSADLENEMSTSYSLPRGVIMVQPADPENRIQLVDSADLENEMSTSYSLSHEVIAVQAAASENKIHLEDSADLDSAMSCHPAEAPPPALDATSIHSDATSICSDVSSICSDATSICSDVSTIHLEAPIIHSDATSISSDVSTIHLEAPIIHSDATSISSDVSTIHLEAPIIHSDASSIRSDANSIRSDATSIRSDATSICSDVSTIYLDDPIIHSDASSIYSDATSIHSDATSIHSDATSIHSDNEDLSHTTSGKKKKKNCMKRFFSWMKRTFCSCCSADDVQE